MTTILTKQVAGLGKVALTPAEIAVHTAAIAEQEAEATFLASIENVRNTTSVSRKAFCTALFLAGVLPKAEAIEAAKGNWPTTFETSLENMTEDDQFGAEMEWVSAATIHRMHPLILILGAHANMSEEQIDALFDITV